MQHIEIHPGFVLIDKIHSQQDNTVKYVFLSQGQVLEFSFIDKRDGKDIICVPSQTGCRMGCKFCFLTDYDLAVRNLSPEEIADGVKYVVEDLRLLIRPDANDVLLISYMGCGEPLLNARNVIESCELIRDWYAGAYETVRFAVASIIPVPAAMRRFTEAVRTRGLAMKFHWSLHSPFDAVRKEMMPHASPVEESVRLVSEFMHETGNSAEVHYSLIEGENDREEDVAELVRLLKGRDLPVKFLRYNPKPECAWTPSPRVRRIRNALEENGIKTEFYAPPGADIGSSCGQFLEDYYVAHTGHGPR